MDRLRIQVVGVAAVALLAAGTMAWAQPAQQEVRGGAPEAAAWGTPGPPPGPPGGPGGPPLLRLPPPDVLERLALTDAQRARLDDARDTALRATIRADAEARLAELDLAKLLDADAPDDAAIAAAVERVGAARLAILRANVVARRALTALLTPAQRTTLRHSVPPPAAGR